MKFQYLSEAPIRRIEVHNFRSIRHQEMFLDDKLDFLIGPANTEKSTFTKLIFFCRKLRDYFFDFLNLRRWFCYDTANLPDIKHNLFVHFASKFREYFGLTQALGKFDVTFYYNMKCNDSLELTVEENGKLKITFSEGMLRKIDNELEHALEFWRSYKRKSVFEDPQHDIFMQSAFGMCKTIFWDEDELIYVPTVTDRHLDPDELFIEFTKEIRSLQPSFSTSLADMISTQKSCDTDTKCVEKAASLVKNIIHAEYRYDNKGENLYQSDSDYIPLRFASASQRSILWIVNLVFMKILKNERCFLVIEEPEAHQFPTTQTDIMKLIALLIHSTNSNIWIITHSPYILNAANLCIYSGQVEDKLDEMQIEYEPVLPKCFRIHPLHYMLDYDAFTTLNSEGSFEDKVPFLRSIRDTKSGLIDVFEIDDASSDVNRAMDDLIDLEVEYIPEDNS